MPISEAENKEAAAQLMDHLITNALITSLPQGYHESNYTKGAVLGHSVIGEECMPGKYWHHSNVFGAWRSTPAKGSTPEFFGGYDSYRWKYNELFLEYQASSGISYGKSDDPPFKILSYYQSLSKKLQGWVYLHSPKKWGHRRTTNNLPTTNLFYRDEK